MPVKREGFIEIPQLATCVGGSSNAYQFESLLFHQAFQVPKMEVLIFWGGFSLKPYMQLIQVRIPPF